MVHMDMNMNAGVTRPTYFLTTCPRISPPGKPAV